MLAILFSPPKAGIINSPEIRSKGGGGGGGGGASKKV